MGKLKNILLVMVRLVITIVIFAIPIYIGINKVLVELIPINEISFYQSCILGYTTKAIQILMSAPLVQNSDN